MVPGSARNWIAVKTINNPVSTKMKRKQRLIGPISNQQVTIRPLTRRHFLGTGLVAGIGAVVLSPRSAWSRLAREAEAGFYKGMCYSAFPPPYDPSTANQTCIFFGSDIAYNPMAALWGTGYMSSSGMRFPGRNDLQKMKDMGVTLVRLYDWEPRNHHLHFLNYCHQLGIKVLAPVSNYFLKPDQGFGQRETQIPKLIESYRNEAGTDYHPAIAGIIIGNEPHLNGFGVAQCETFTRDWVRIEHQHFSGFSRPLIGHPVDFGKRNERFPAWHFWKNLLEGLESTTTRDLQNRLFLAPQPQNDATYLFENAEGSGEGYVQQTYAEFKKPLLFTEIGHNRRAPNYLAVVDGQLKHSIAYGTRHPEHLLGICHFQFDDKVWLCPTGGTCPSEGSFGVFSHTNTVLFTVNYVSEDFTHFDNGPCANQQLKPDELTQNPIYGTVVADYS
jgi:hypothetical protein